MSARRWGTLALAGVVVAFGIGGKEKGNRLYRAGKYAEAAAAYAKALKDGDNSPDLHYDLGTALLRLGRYREAEQHFREALRDVQPVLRERTLYNLGNRYLYSARAQTGASLPPGMAQAGASAGASAGTLGAGAAGGAPAGPGAGVSPGAGGAAPSSDTRAELDAAIKSYQQALRIDPRDEWAKWNLELALKQQQQSGGGGQQQKRGGGGGGGQQKPSPQGQGAQNSQTQRGQMSQSQADRILSAAENDERQLYKEKVRQGNREVPVTRDW